MLKRKAQPKLLKTSAQYHFEGLTTKANLSLTSKVELELNLAD